MGGGPIGFAWEGTGILKGGGQHRGSEMFGKNLHCPQRKRLHQSDALSQMRWAGDRHPVFGRPCNTSTIS